MASEGNKALPTGADVRAFVSSVPDEQRRQDAHRLVEVVSNATGQQPVMWGASIIGFGSRHYRYESGREGDAPAVGFSPRKAQTVLYLTGALEDYADLLARLGQHRTGKGCLYLKRVDQVDPAVLGEITARSFQKATSSERPPSAAGR